MTTTLCEVKVPISPARRQDLLKACKRLDLSWPQIVWRVQCAMQDAATREMVKLIESQHPPRDEVSVTPAPEFVEETLTGDAPASTVAGEGAGLIAEIDALGDELQGMVQRLNGLHRRPGAPGQGPEV